MALTSTERGRRFRERHRGEPRGNKLMQAQLAALQRRVAELEAELAAHITGRLQSTVRMAAGSVSGVEAGARRTG